MPKLTSPLSAAQLNAYELASHELNRVLEHATDTLWHLCGPTSLVGRLADVARWSAFLLHERVRVQTLRDAHPQRRLLARSPRRVDFLLPHPGRFRLDSPPGAVPLGPLDMGVVREIVRILTTCKASVRGMMGGFGRAVSPGHPVLEALLGVAQALNGLLRALLRR